MSVWDDPELRVGGDFVKFENVGDTISGTISAVRAHRFDDGKVAPQILLTTDDGEEKTITAGQVRLKVALSEERPEAGDHITITLSNVEKRAGGKTLKHFEVKVTRGNGAPATAASTGAASAAPAAVPAGVTPEALAALAALSDDQKAALGIS
jgi:hypothetical protein